MNTSPKKGDIRVADKSAIQRIKDLDAERASIFDRAKEEALEKAKAAVAELNGLGFNYTLTNGAGKAGKAGSAKGKRTIKAAACPICEFQTTPPHDGRTHRNQKKKSPFSAAELKEKRAGEGISTGRQAQHRATSLAASASTGGAPPEE
jgi:hypothetical protein